MEAMPDATVECHGRMPRSAGAVLYLARNREELLIVLNHYKA